ncbi:MAG: N-acetylneuraminate synthase family protein, partial [Thiotrichaceae bacterium]|nr:N-acetylneuraminate synthase family protein [Thiotrichaceae bacterium]
MNEKVFIIAEAGVNHNGSIELARKLIDTAADAGADAVKFQTFQADRMITKGTAKALYQQQTTKKNESQFMLIKKLELDENAHRVLITHCHAKGIIFLSSPFDLESIDLLCELGLNTLKIPSGEITNLPYLRKIGSVQKKLILSTGMANLAEIEDALLVLIRAGTSPQSITVLH